MSTNTREAIDLLVTATQLLLRSFDLRTRAERTLRDVREALRHDPESGALAKLNDAVQLAVVDLRQAGQLERDAQALRDERDPAERFSDARELLEESCHAKC